MRLNYILVFIMICPCIRGSVFCLPGFADNKKRIVFSAIQLRQVVEEMDNNSHYDLEKVVKTIPLILSDTEAKTAYMQDLSSMGTDKIRALDLSSLISALVSQSELAYKNSDLERMKRGFILSVEVALRPYLIVDQSNVNLKDPIKSSLITVPTAATVYYVGRALNGMYPYKLRQYNKDIHEVYNQLDKIREINKEYISLIKNNKNYDNVNNIIGKLRQIKSEVLVLRSKLCSIHKLPIVEQQTQ